MNEICFRQHAKVLADCSFKPMAFDAGIVVKRLHIMRRR